MDRELKSRNGFERNHFSLASWLAMFLPQIFTWTQNGARQGLNDVAYFKVPFTTIKTKYFPSSSSQVGYDFKISVSPVY